MRFFSSILPSFVFLSLAVAAPVPEDKDVPKPRAKIIGSIKLNREVKQVLWSPDGKFLLAVTADRLLHVYPRADFEPDAKSKPMETIPLPDVRTWKLHAGSKTLYGISPAKNFSADSRLYSWDLQPILDGKAPAKPDRSISLESDSPFDGTLNGDGKRLFVQMNEIKANPNPDPQRGDTYRTVSKWLRHSAKTGDALDEVWKFDDPEKRFLAQAIHSETDRFVAVFGDANATTLQAIDLETGKETWKTILEGRPYYSGNSGRYALLHSPDGKLLACLHAEAFSTPIAPQQQPGGGGGFQGRPQINLTERSRVYLLNAKDGESAGALDMEDVSTATLESFSADGKLIAGGTNGMRSSNNYKVWDVKSGKVVKTWTLNTGYDSNGIANSVQGRFAFSPLRHELAAVEIETKIERNLVDTGFAQPGGGGFGNPGPGGGGGRAASSLPRSVTTRGETTSTIAIWDFAAVAPK